MRKSITFCLLLFVLTIPVDKQIGQATIQPRQQFGQMNSALAQQSPGHGSKSDRLSLYAKAPRGENLCTYKGPTTGNWEVAANWSCGHVPMINNDVEIFTGTVTLNSDAEINTITIGNGAGLIVTTGRNITVKH